MREIKFRFWNIKCKRMVYTAGIGCIYEYLRDEYKHFDWRDTITLQYTGLKDKNGKEIYEGDIVTADNSWVMDKKARYEICWHHYGWAQSLIRLDGGPRYTYPYATHPERYDGLEVIGNIYENPELLGILNE